MRSLAASHRQAGDGLIMGSASLQQLRDNITLLTAAEVGPLPQPGMIYIYIYDTEQGTVMSVRVSCGTSAHQLARYLD